jgi:UDP-glucuronate 4-epimerase
MAVPPSGGDSPAGEPRESGAPYRILNVGNGRPVELLDYIRTLETCIGRKAELHLLPMQPGDIEATLADVSRLERAIGYRPVTTVDEGVRRFVDWYAAHYQVAL